MLSVYCPVPLTSFTPFYIWHIQNQTSFSVSLSYLVSDPSRNWKVVSKTPSHLIKMKHLTWFHSDIWSTLSSLQFLQWRRIFYWIITSHQLCLSEKRKNRIIRFFLEYQNLKQNKKPSQPLTLYLFIIWSIIFLILCTLLFYI